MPNPYAGIDDFPDTIDVIDDGDPPEAASWAPADEGNANRTIWLKRRNPATGEPDGTDYRVHLPLSSLIDTSTGTEWTLDDPSGLGIGWLQIANAGDRLIVILPHFPGMRLNGAEVCWNPQSGRSDLPAVLPGIELYRIAAPPPGTPGSRTLIDSDTASYGTLAAYEADRFQLGGNLGVAVASDFEIENPLALYITGETGANAAPNLLFLERITIRLEPI